MICPKGGSNSAINKVISTTQPDLILASSSPRRRDLLGQLGVTPSQIIPAEIDETPWKTELPKPYVERMAREKAKAVAEQYPQAYVLAGDTTVACGRRILGKAESEQEAQTYLRLLSGRRHQVHTAIALAPPQGTLKIKCVKSMVQFKRLTNADMAWYLATGEWQGKAGGYAIQGAAQALINQMHGSYSAVVGLPLLETRHLLQQAGAVD